MLVIEKVQIIPGGSCYSPKMEDPSILVQQLNKSEAIKLCSILTFTANTRLYLEPHSLGKGIRRTIRLLILSRHHKQANNFEIRPRDRPETRSRSPQSQIDTYSDCILWEIVHLFPLVRLRGGSRRERKFALSLCPAAKRPPSLPTHYKLFTPGKKSGP